MVYHVARDCLLRRTRGDVCRKKDCQARQRVLNSYIKSCGRVIYLNLFTKKKKQEKYDFVNDANNTDRIARGRSIHRRDDLSRKRARSSTIRIPLRKPLRNCACGGAPTKKIDLKKYVEIYRLCNIPLRQKISLQHDVPLIGKHYFRTDTLSEAKQKRIWIFHQNNYKEICREYKRQISERNLLNPSCLATKEHFTINVCCGIMEKVMITHDSNDLADHQQFAVHVCSRIAAEIMHDSSETVPMIRKVSTSDHSVASSEDMLQNEAQAIFQNGLNADSSSLNQSALHSDNDSCQHECNEKEDFHNEAEKGAGIFSKVGLPTEVAYAMSKSNIPRKEMFEVVLDQTEQQIALDSSWKNLPIVISASGRRRLGGEWTVFFNNILESLNTYCVFAFKNNDVKQQTSRKKKSPFFKANAFCTVTPCQCKVAICIQDDHSDTIKVKFTGNIRHDSSVLKARRITGEERETIKRHFIETRENPSSLYRKKLCKVSNEAFASGSRSGCGVTPKAFQHISSEANAVRNDVNLIAGKIRKCDEQIRYENTKMYKSLMTTQKLSGYVQSNDITKYNLSVVLLDEGSVRLYRHVCQKDIIFFDATGTIVEKIPGLKRILLYSLTTRHPFGKTPPVPLAEMISSAHNADAIRRLFTVLREKERSLYGNNLLPFCIKTDFSLAIISACIREYTNGMSVTEYLDRCFDIICNEKREQEDTTIVSICAAHVMKTNSKNVEILARKTASVDVQRSIKHLSMRIVGVLVNTEKMQDALVVIKLAYIAFMSPKQTKQLKDALKRLTEIVNDFKVRDCSVENITDLNETSFCNEQEPSYLQCDGKFKILIDTSLETVNLEEDADTEANKYYLPSYMDYMRRILLPFLPMWSRLVLQPELNRRFAAIEQFSGKTCLDATATNSYAENYFTFVKQSFTTESVPIDTFIYRHYNDVIGLRRQYLDAVRTSIGKNKRKRKEQSELAGIEKATPRYPDDDGVFDSRIDIPAEEEEEWNKEKRSKNRKRVFGRYQEPPTTPIHFTASRTKEGKKNSNLSRGGINSNEDRMRFQLYKSQNWAAISPKTPSTEACINVLKRNYLQLPDEEKRALNTFRPRQKVLHCICRRPYKPSDPLMVQCNICHEWYHCDCINMGEVFLSEQIPRYHCDACTEVKFRALASYITHSGMQAYDGNSDKIRECFEELWALDNYSRQIIQSHKFLPSSSPRSCPRPIMFKHSRGIRNERSNCWLSTIVHLVCGTIIADLLLSYDGSMRLEVSRFITMCRIRLAKDVKAPLTLRMVQDLGLLLDPLEFNPKSNEEKDASEFYASLLTHYMENVPCDRLFADFKVVCLEMRQCLTCHNASGTFHSGTFLNLTISDQQEPVTLEDALWAHLRGQHYENNDDISRTVCQSHCKEHSIWETTFLHNLPSVLAINLKRSNWNVSNPRVNHTPVVVPRHLDLTDHAARRTDEKLKYKLGAVISHYAVTPACGHYAVHLLDDNMVTTFDDLEVKTRNVANFLQLSALQKSAHIVIYYLLPDSNCEESKRGTRMLSQEEQRLTEKYWFGLLAPNNRQVDLHDVRTCWSDAQLNGDIITQFLYAVSKEIDNRKIIATSSAFLSGIEYGKCMKSAECSRILRSPETLEHDVIIIPENVNGNHWVIVGIYPQGQCVVVLDSLRDQCARKVVFKKALLFLRIYADVHNLDFYPSDWVCIFPRHLPAQTDASSCGVFACINGYNMMLPNQTYNVNSGNILFCRYWIAYLSCMSSDITQRPKTARIEWDKDLQEPKDDSIMIRSMVPGYGKMCNFFEAVRSYVDRRSCCNRKDRNKVNSNDKEINQAKVDERHCEPEQDIPGVEADLPLHMEDSDASDASSNSLDRENMQIRKKLQQLSQLKERLLERLRFDVNDCNERYIVLAKYGKALLLEYFRRELIMLREYLEDCDMEIMKGALYRLFCNDVPDHQYFGVSLPTIEKNRYGLTSIQIIDFVILPDALCLDMMAINNISYEEAVSRICGEQRSRLTVYWHKVLLKDNRVTARKAIRQDLEIQVMVGELWKERAHAIVAVVNNELKAVGKESEEVVEMSSLDVESEITKQKAIDDFQNTSITVCGPGNLKCDRLILSLVSEQPFDTEEANGQLEARLEEIMDEVLNSGFESITMPLILQNNYDSERKKHTAKQIDFLTTRLHAASPGALAVVKIVVASATWLNSDI